MSKGLQASFWFTLGWVLMLIVEVYVIPHPTYTETTKGWVLEHVQTPTCNGPHTIEYPERDEVDALTIRCEAR